MTPIKSAPEPMKVAVRCNNCFRVVGYKLSATSGVFQLKCPKCGKELHIGLSLRRAKVPIFYRRSNIPITFSVR